VVDCGEVYQLKEAKMFLGEFEYKIDEKGRLPIPPKYRKDLKDGIVLTAGPERCIVAYSIAEWNKVAAKLTSGAVAPSKMRKLNRAFFATAFSLVIDGQGRVALPIPLREYAGIDDEIIIAGVNTHIELWNKEQWEAEKTDDQEQFWQIIESLEERN